MERINEYLDQCFNAYVRNEELDNLKEEILANATEHFADCINHGESKEEAEATVMDSLGDIPSLLTEIGAVKKDEEPAQFDPFGTDMFQGFSGSLNNMFNSLFQTSSKNGTRAETYNDIVSVNIQGFSVDIHVKPSTDDLLHVEAEGNLDQISMKAERGLLKIVEEASAKKLFHNGMDLTLELPVHLQAIDVQVVSGDLDLEDASLESLRFQSTSGDLSIKNAAVNDLAIRTASGDADLNLISVNRLYAELSSGDVDLVCEKAGSVACSCQSGDINGVFKSSFDSIGFKTVSGDVALKMKAKEPVQTDLNTVFGTIDSRTASTEGGKEVIIRTVSGDISVR